MKSEMFKAIRDRKIKYRCSERHYLELYAGGYSVHAENETRDFLAALLSY
jgi:hypothetical protein